MDGEVGVLRHFILQLNQLLQVYGLSPQGDNNHYFIQLRPPQSPPVQPPVPPLHHHPRWRFLNFEDNSPEDSCYDLIMTAGKSEYLKMLDPGKPPPVKRCREERNQGTITTAASLPEMEHHIWKEFPEDLFEAVLARFPIATFFRLRIVCKRWNSMLNSESFARQYAQVPRSHCWFYTVSHEGLKLGSMYDPTMKKWHNTTIQMPSKLIGLPVASAGGLICFLEVGHRNFYVVNPLTKAAKELPPRSYKVWSRVVVGMTWTGKSLGEGYKIVWVSPTGEYDVYDSLKGCWTCPGSMPSHIYLPLTLNFKSQAVSLNGTLYFMRCNPDGIVSYDVSTGIWEQFIIPFPRYLTDCALAESGGKILLVGLLTNNAAMCICIWELQKMTLLWKEVDRMPNLLCLDFYGKHVRMTCLGNKGLLMLSLWSKESSPVIAYNVASRAWLEVPACVLPDGRKREWIAWGTMFHPNPTSSP